ncbi:MAG: methyltransferase domain-containing protein [Rhodospirillaceae bacterium]
MKPSLSAGYDIKENIASASDRGAESIKIMMSCAICGGDITVAIDLPNLPLTETYCLEPVKQTPPGIDQQLQICATCGHGQLQVQLSPNLLYDSQYKFRTSASPTARRGTEFFLSVLNALAPERKFNCALDLGCNDLFLLSQLAGAAKNRVGVDPVWRGRESENADKSIEVHGCNFEELPTESLPSKPDLIVCRHTLEHISEPVKVLSRIMEIAAPDALFIFEVPGFDNLIERGRFDQIFHQHLHYFSLSSFTALLKQVGASLIIHRENFHDWGAIAMAFVKGNENADQKLIFTPPSHDVIATRFRQFKQHLSSTKLVMAEIAQSHRLYGYGAAQMLPVLAYHLGTDLKNFEAIIDDDPDKDGLGYWNLPVKIIPSSKVADMKESAVLITAIDNVQPIMTKLLEIRPRHIVYPFNLI